MALPAFGVCAPAMIKLAGDARRHRARILALFRRVAALSQRFCRASAGRLKEAPNLANLIYLSALKYTPRSHKHHKVDEPPEKVKALRPWPQLAGALTLDRATHFPRSRRQPECIFQRLEAVVSCGVEAAFSTTANADINFMVVLEAKPPDLLANRP
ncbi:hypothetical protein EVAR_40159_1 [Eumeta japonica]|uniref:Uncharacterized protein n=1 Tax=Eumeta variegata TaxID=151549 RepID=A0A4C1YI62_EUMVA|nr:hypothetical protein EVAR_40159_1 [Eumeta japonica]